MTGNIALDVIIGLVFIYTLYSLLTTTIVELIATYFQFRARNLEKGIQRMLDDDTQAVLSKEFYKTPLIKYMASGQWKIYNKPSYIKARNFSKGLIHVLTENKPQGMDTLVKIRETLMQYKDTQTGKFLLAELDEAKGKLEDFKASLETWFDDTMERVTGWYKRKIWCITFIVGLIVATALNVDSIQIVRKLSRDPKMREQFIAVAKEVTANPDLRKSTYDPELLQRLKADTAITNIYNTPEKLKDFLADTLQKSNITKQKILTARLKSLDEYTRQSQYILYFKRPDTHWYIFTNLSNFFGCLATALALSLGSPFWFDLLNKLVNLRGNILKKEEEKQEK